MEDDKKRDYMVTAEICPGLTIQKRCKSSLDAAMFSRAFTHSAVPVSDMEKVKEMILKDAR